ncbi:MAG: IS21 family transposase [Deltaproteobacteria bacterium]|nr:IS21 family transposase [Deltaproteobacteria bacterium]
MRKIREILRLKWEHDCSVRQIAESCQVARPTVTEYLERATAAGLSWPLPPELDESALERVLFPPRAQPVTSPRAVPDWATVHRELQRKSVTLLLLWQEYKTQHPTGYSYTWFCTRYHAWAKHLDVVMRHEHRAGEKVFIDYAGETVPVQDPRTGEIRQAQIFVAALGASSYTYIEATWTQSLPDWIGSHVRMFAYFGGCPEILVPDNIRSGVTAAHRYEPDLNPTYHELATHYGVAVMPARSRKPRDKAKVESAVQLAERWILAQLRHCTFLSLAELNAAIDNALTVLNHREFQKLPGSRHSRFLTVDHPALRPLPLLPYEYAEWKKATVHIDYHVEVDHHYYSVPYTLVGQRVDVRLTTNCVECFHKSQRVSSHRRSSLPGQHTTVTEHMPQAHQAYAEWTPERLVRWAQQSRPATAQLVTAILISRAHPLQGFRSCLGIMRLGKSHGDERLEAACARALALQAHSYKSVASILRHGLDQQPLSPDRVSPPSIRHPNIRGPHYYH